MLNKSNVLMFLFSNKLHWSPIPQYSVLPIHSQYMAVYCSGVPTPVLQYEKMN